MEIIARKDAQSLGVKRYFTGKPCKHGHISERLVSSGSCCTCDLHRNRQRVANNPEYWRDYYKQYRVDNAGRNREYRAEWRALNRDKINANLRRYRRDNRDAVRENERRYRLENADKTRADGRRQYAKRRPHYREKAKRYAQRNRSKVSARYREYSQKNRDKINASRRRLYQSPSVKLACFMRNCVARTVSEKNAPSFELIGYIPSQLKSHIEKQFLRGMSWDNYGDWHIDHVIPLSRLIADGEDDPSKINCLSNLRPLWAKDNQAKSNKVQSLL